MIVGGYKLRGYDASYDKAVFDVREGRNASGNRVLEVTDIDSGITFIVEFDDPKKKNRRRK